MKTRKDLIKNIAIIFLAIMLVLTFFSNTILNWSLPQVSGKYTEYGEIKTGVRGSGTVISNMTYTETVRGNRTVEAVYVNRGSEVEKGDLLMLMSPTESDGIKALETEIEAMQDAYDRALLGRTENDYSSDEMSIRNAEEDLAELKEERAVYTDEYIAGVKKAAEDADRAVGEAEARVEELTEKLDEISESSSEPEIVAARNEAEKKQEAFDKAEEEAEIAAKALDEAGYVDVSSMESQLDSARNRVSNLKTELRYLKEDNAELLKIAADYNTKKSELNKAQNEYDKAKQKFENDDTELPDEEKETYKAMVKAQSEMNEAQTAYDTAKAAYEADTSTLPDEEKDSYKAMKEAETKLNEAKSIYESAKAAFEADDSQLPDEEKDTYKAMKEAEAKLNEAKGAFDAAESLYNDNLDGIKAAKRAIEQKESDISDAEADVYTLRLAITEANADNREYNGLKNTLDIKKAAVETAEKELNEAKTALENAVKRHNKAISDELKAAKKTLEAANEVKSEADKELGGLSVIDSLDDQIKSGERNLESMKLSLEKRKENDSNSDRIEQYDLNKQYRAIQEKKKELSELKGESKEGYELRATHSGVITEVNFKAGEIAAEGSAAVVIEVQESGYTLSFSVSNAEAMKVKEGDTAQVSDTYWGQNVGAVLKSIVPDAGGKTRTLNFELSGNVNVGQTLTLLVGERSTSYSAVIPKSAIREDTKGKFVYITKTKSTPLGNRYVAERLDVRIAAEDDKNAAIVTDESYIYEYVIVSSTKPFEEGGYVRLSD